MTVSSTCWAMSAARCCADQVAGNSFARVRSAIQPTAGSRTSATTVSSGESHSIAADRHDDEHHRAERERHHRQQRLHELQVGDRARHDLAGAQRVLPLAVEALHGGEDLPAQVVLHVEGEPAGEVAAQERRAEPHERQPEHRHDDRAERRGGAGDRVVDGHPGEQRPDRLQADPERRRHQRADRHRTVTEAGVDEPADPAGGGSIGHVSTVCRRSDTRGRASQRRSRIGVRCGWIGTPRRSLALLWAPRSMPRLRAPTDRRSPGALHDHRSGGRRAAGRRHASSAAAADADANTLRVGTEGTYSPFSFQGTDGKLTGYDVEVVQAVGAKLGKEVEFVQTPWDAIFAGLEAQRFDLVANQVTINDERKAKYDLSEPYTVSEGVIVTRADNTDITTLADLRGQDHRAVRDQQLGHRWPGTPARTWRRWRASCRPSSCSRTAGSTPRSTTRWRSASTRRPRNDTGVKIAGTTGDTSEQAFAARKDSGLIADVNRALDELRADGTLKQISEKYFGSDVSGA